jgi:hypothetical protein
MISMQKGQVTQLSDLAFFIFLRHQPPLKLIAA